MLILGFVVAQIIIFAVIIIILKRLIFQDTTSAINRINKLDGMNREKEKVLAQKLEETERYLEKKKKELEDEEKLLKQEAQRAAMQLQEDILKKAKTEAEDIVKKAYATKDKIRIEALIEAESKMIDMCREVLGRVISSIVQAQINDQIIQEFLKELETVDMGRVSKDVKLVEIFTGRMLSEETQEIVKVILQKRLNREIEVVVKEDHQLLAGVVMKFGTLVVDGSLFERLKETSDKMKEELSWKYTT